MALLELLELPSDSYPGKSTVLIECFNPVPPLTNPFNLGTSNKPLFAAFLNLAKFRLKTGSSSLIFLYTASNVWYAFLNLYNAFTLSTIPLFSVNNINNAFSNVDSANVTWNSVPGGYIFDVANWCRTLYLALVVEALSASFNVLCALAITSGSNPNVASINSITPNASGNMACGLPSDEPSCACSCKSSVPCCVLSSNR